MAFQLFGNKKKSASTAKNRLEMMLYMERLGLTPETLAQMKAEIVQVVEKYVPIDEENFDIKVNREGESVDANIPIKAGSKR